MGEPGVVINPSDYTLEYIKNNLQDVDLNYALKHAPFDVIIELSKTKITETVELFWGIVSCREDLTKEYIIQYADYLEWQYISMFTSLDIIFDLAESFKDDFVWFYISHRDMNEEFIRKFSDNIEWTSINYVFLQNLSDQFFYDFKDKISWGLISCLNLNEKFIEKHDNNLNWNLISVNSILSEDFMRKYQNKLEWSSISKFQKISNSFKEDFKDKLTLELIEIREASIDPKDYTLEYIEKYAEYLSWFTISQYCSLDVISEICDSQYSENIIWNIVSSRFLNEIFVRKYSEKINWNVLTRLLKVSNYSKEFYEDFEDKINWEVFLTL